MRKIPQIADHGHHVPGWRRYGFAIGCTALALAARLALDSTLGEVQPYAIFYLSVALSAWRAGTGPAVLASAVGLVCGSVLFLGKDVAADVATLVPMLTYTSVCACFIMILRYARRKEADAASQRALLEAVLEACPAGVIVADVHGRILRMNAANQRLWGAAPFSSTIEEYREWKGWWADGTDRDGRRVEPQDWAMARALCGEVSTGDIVEIERFDPSRQHRIILNSGAPVRDPTGQIIGAVVVQMDITERRQAEVQLRYRSEQLAALLAHAPIGVHLVDADFRIAHVNPVGLPAFGDIPNLIGRDFGDVMRIIWPAEVAEEVVRLFRHTLTEGVSHHQPEMVHIRADRGVREYYDWRIDRLTLPDGRYGVVCYFSDISRQMLARDAIAASELRYRTLFESIDEGFCVLELIFDAANQPIDYRFIEFNPAFEQQTGIRVAVGRTVRELLPEVESFWFATYGRVAITGQPTRFINRSDALGRWFDVYAFRVGEPAERRVAVLFNDITARREAEEALALANRKLQTTLSSLEQTVTERTAQLSESVHELESFSYSISHDMRAPLRAMLGYAEILEVDYGKELGAEGGAYLRRITASARRLDQLIQDVLSYSKVSRGGLTLQPVSVEKLISQLLDENPMLQRPKALIEIEHPLPPVLAHEAYLAQILSNLLYNAVKFMPAGRTPEIRVWADVSDDKVRLHVADNGIGIPVAAQARIFEMFERLHGQQEYEGTGIGLAIVRKAVERMNGRLGVASEFGKGSVFWIELNAAKGGKTEASARPGP